mmetsp:Transcript_15802/g.19596  ORF Transcript_15802/g.19596 Transcript_15802/m.19596 type:complete len:274 (-) Transcript_15802:381-1202(-)
MDLRENSEVELPESQKFSHITSAPLNKEFPSVQGLVPYFCARNPFVKPGDEEDDVIKPSNVASAMLIFVWFLLSPFWNVSGWSVGNSLVQAVLAVCFIEGNSGMFHIVFDNENLNQFPIIGPLAKDFQIHHVQPAAITKVNIIEYLQQVHLPGVLIIPLQVFLTREWVSMRPFWFFTILYLHVMFLAHRWAHMLPGENYKTVSWAQKHGLLLSMKHHVQHHKTYDCNYSIFMGWGDLLYNPLTKHLLHHESLLYLPLYALYCHLPSIIYMFCK